MNKYKLVTTIEDNSIPEGALGALLPVPPTTPEQKAGELVLSPEWHTRICNAQNAPQAAVFAAFPNRSFTEPITIEIDLDDGELLEEHFIAHPSKSLDPGQDAIALFAELRLCGTTGERKNLLEIVDCVARKFNYQHGVNSDSPLTCDVLTGNCLDINTALIKLLRLASIKNAYYIGYFFEQDKPLINDDWHCWVSTLSEERFENWDIAHFLKRDKTRVEPTLNPIPGIRFAMSTGRDLRFNLSEAPVIASHLCEPRWVFYDGSTRQCRVKVTAELMN